MSLNTEQLKEHCKMILESRRIKNKIVVLCEGVISTIDGIKSPQAYKNMEKMPDANFYNACVPKWWTQQRPQFFNCGDRATVINTYLNLLTLHEQDTTNSYLDPDRLFAMIDLDLHLQEIDNYSFPDTEAIFCNLYEKSQVKAQNAKQHRIWITGLIHKEAYFITPELQSIFDDYPNSPMYQDNPVQLNSIYMDMGDKISSDPDLKNNLNIQRSLQRINHCLNCTDLDKLQDSWKTEFQNTSDETRKHQLIRALLTIKKVKNEKQPEHDYWEKIKPAGDFSRGERVFREQLSLKIGEFYSHQSSDVNCHIPFFFKTLHEFV
ncbi:MULTISPECIES: hypothetical protein [unclassified Microcoleus]|uniref:hypothetical protein n=1 Tax=unclassified Microcoleus TaxID=2642155 RepID=UPI0025D6C170|nr:MULTISPECIES: hypothetical protein [unclassified Microcoleus]